MQCVFKYLTDDESIDANVIVNDTGTGPISRGMIFLELVSSAKRRDNMRVLECLDAPAAIHASIMFDTPLNKITEDQKVCFIATSLKCHELVKRMRNECPEKYEYIKNALIYLFNETYSGNFRREKYERCFIPYMKKTVQKMQKNFTKQETVNINA